MKKITPFLLGGGQEKGIRSGTENLASILCFEKCLKDSISHMEERLEHVKKLNASKVLFKKLSEVKEYADKLQLKEENKKKMSERLDSINSDIKELEIRLKKDIPELDKRLDINNFR